MSMNSTMSAPKAAPAALHVLPLDAGERPAQTYWPSQLLNAFSFRMSAHGLCVNSAMMLGDHSYALARLAQAHTTDDEMLRRVAVELFRFFEHHRAGQARLN
jgi:hypothetical protein